MSDTVDAKRIAAETADPQKVSRPASRAPRKADTKLIEEGLEQLFAAGAMVFQVRGDSFCAEHMLTNANVPARAWAKLAEQNETVARILEAFVTGGQWTEVLMSTAAFVVPILAHHGRAPKEVSAFFGVQVPGPQAVPEETVTPIHTENGTFTGFEPEPIP